MTLSPRTRPQLLQTMSPLHGRLQRVSLSALMKLTHLANCSMRDEFSRQSGHIKRTFLRERDRAERVPTSSAR